MTKIYIKEIRNGGKKKGLKIEVNGVTKDNKIVLSGKSIFRFMDTKGLPLDFILMNICKESFIIDWFEFIETSLSNNWRISGTLTKLEESFLDYYDKDFSSEILLRLRKRFLYS